MQLQDVAVLARPQQSRHSEVTLHKAHGMAYVSRNTWSHSIQNAFC